MARIARVVAPGIPHYVTQRGNRRHGSGNEYVSPEFSAWKREGKQGGSVSTVKVEIFSDYL